jgi:hypothetical protein
MSRLPVPGADSGTWGIILNDYLSQSINGDGTLSSTAVAKAELKVSIQTSNYGPGSTQSEFILANANSGAIIVTLPTAVGNIFYYGIKKTDSSTHTVTVATTSSQTIDGGSTAIIQVPYVSVTLISDGSNWNVI